MAKVDPETLAMVKAMQDAGLKPADMPELKKLLDATKAKPATEQKPVATEEEKAAPESFWGRVFSDFGKETARLEAERAKRKA
ncbi:hypothetical protein HY375_02270 [Candidatus Berkelbacteria bacterium]|nr:hypothetical protein [Candidatus Berkelbacteria bacterium]